MANMPVSLLSWKPLARNTLKGFADVRVGKSLIIREVSVHTSHGKRWASLPSKPMIKDGRTVTNESGKVQYVPVMEWADKDAREAFSGGVIEAIEREHPGATAA